MNQLRKDALATLVHISDLHFSMPLRSHTARAHALRLWSMAHAVDGWLGESGDALIDLEEFWESLNDEGFEQDPYLIVTGDLTAFAHAEHFRRCRAFMHGEAGVDHVGPGLRAPAWLNLTIPGNHDQWPGVPWMLGATSAAGRDMFPHGPFLRTLPLANGRRAVICGINSDADVAPRSHRRLRAAGDFRSELVHLAAILSQPRPAEEIRVLLLHHAWGYSGGWRLYITDPSKRALEDFIDAYGFRLLLCGHLHKALAKRRWTRTGKSQFLEARCGTTTQWDLVPVQDIALLGRFLPARRLDPNALMVHQIVEQNGGTIWQTSTFMRKSGLDGFVRSADPTWTAQIDV